MREDIRTLCQVYAEKNGLDVSLLYAFCEVESSGNPSVVSANGQYWGLMQLNKDTFSGDLTDPENNIAQGAEYLALLKDQSDGDILVAISKYSGEGGRIGYYSRKVIDKYFIYYCQYELKREDKKL